jgi:hypothetical protein
MKNYGAIE